MKQIRTDWSREQAAEIYRMPLINLIYEAAGVHRAFHNPQQVQVCSLLSIKTGGCPEDCKYCTQSAHYETDTKASKMMDPEKVISQARAAKESGVTRFCMGASGTRVKDNLEFEKVLHMVREISAMGLEACCTLGMLTLPQAKRLKEAGLYAYNHNLDTSERFYPEVITTRTYAERLETIANVREAGITVCCGGILGLGESHDDRIDLLHTLATLPAHPESLPVNVLKPFAGTPLANQKESVSVADRVRFIGTARILMPKVMIRLSAGRSDLSEAEQALCILAGANSLWNSKKLLCSDNQAHEMTTGLFEALGLEAQEMASSSAA